MKRDRAYYLDTYIAGRLYADADKAWPSLRIGTPVRLVREPDNPKDPEAIAVYVNIEEQLLKLGYLPYRRTSPIALFLDMGWEAAFGATISRLDPSATYDRQIGIIIRILRNNLDGER
ncbi:MAG: HIRAN domain-containing protein [Muribaculaceae bacterium]|nr:HIRAN domain-containing protein [Muribaculaceae bacterium]